MSNKHCWVCGKEVHLPCRADIFGYICRECAGDEGFTVFGPPHPDQLDRSSETVSGRGPHEPA